MSTEGATDIELLARSGMLFAPMAKHASCGSPKNLNQTEQSNELNNSTG